MQKQVTQVSWQRQKFEHPLQLKCNQQQNSACRLGSMSRPPSGIKTPPRFKKWDARSRLDLKERLLEAVEKRRQRLDKLISRITRQELVVFGLAAHSEAFHISDTTVVQPTRDAITCHLSAWKGLRWWRFDEKTLCDSWLKWFKKAKCWSDQNQYKPLGTFWCLALDQLTAFIHSIAARAYPRSLHKQQTLSQCLLSKAMLCISTASIQFKQTRETPLLSVRVLTHSKPLQQRLQQLEGGFTLAAWKGEAERAFKRQKKESRRGAKPRANVAMFVSEQCSEHALALYRRRLLAMGLDVQAMAHATAGYAPTRGRASGSLAHTQRYSPIRSPPKPAPPNSKRESALSRLSAENARLKAELASVRLEEHEDTIRALVQQMGAQTHMMNRMMLQQSRMHSAYPMFAPPQPLPLPPMPYVPMSMPLDVGGANAIPPSLNGIEADDGSVWQFQPLEAMSTTYPVFDNESVFAPMPIPTMPSTGSPDTGDSASTHRLL